MFCSADAAQKTESVPALRKTESVPALRDIRGLLANLAAWSMIRLTGDTFTVHRLVQDAARLRIAAEHRQAWAHLAVALVNDDEGGDKPPYDVRNWWWWEPMETRLVAALDYHKEAATEGANTRLMDALGLYLQARARFAEAESLMRRALEIDKASYGPDHPNVAIRLGNLGSLLQARDNPAEGKKLVERALTIFEQSFDADHPYVVETKRRLTTLDA